VEKVGAGDEVDVIVNQTPFYGESGGQVGDAGTIANEAGVAGVVTDTSKQLGKLWVHHATLSAGELKVGDTVKLSIDVTRRAAIRANHSATHLLHEALRQRLGTHVAQKGSLVAPDRLRFDVSHSSAMTPAELADAEAAVNAKIRQNGGVTTLLMTPDDAIAMGAMALFGEKYGDEVRVVSMGSDDDGKTYSVELCGGTHVKSLGDIGLFKVIGEGAVSSGVRRVEALTGEAARAYLTNRDDKLREAAATLKATPDEVPARVAALMEDRRRLERELAEAKKALALGGGGGAALAGPETVGGVAFVGQVLDGFEAKGLRGAVDEAKKRIGSGVAALVAVNDGRATVAVGVTDDLVATWSAVDLVKRGVAAVGGQGGGGRPDMAQGGGPDGSKAADALAAIRVALEEAKEIA
jgi:alanyl-tRNA synthetase